MTQKLERLERLRSKNKIEETYHLGKSISSFPLKIIYKEAELVAEEQPLLVLFSVPKKKFKKAVLRNRIRRQMKEVYRLNKELLLPHLKENNKQLALFILYIGKEMPTYSVISDKIILLLKRLKEEN